MGSQRRTPVEQYMNWCRHYTGIGNGEACKLGICYSTVKVAREPTPDDGRPYEIPCIKRNGLTNCDRADFPTREEAEAHEREVQAMITHMVAARHLITTNSEGRRGVSGTVPCPKCNNPLHYSVAGYNGHVRARCETPDCLAWME